MPVDCPVFANVDFCLFNSDCCRSWRREAVRTEIEIRAERERPFVVFGLKVGELLPH